MVVKRWARGGSEKKRKIRMEGGDVEGVTER